MVNHLSFAVKRLFCAIIFFLILSGMDSGVMKGLKAQDVIPPAISNVSNSPNPFSPDGDGINDIVTISLVLSEPVDSLFFAIFDTIPPTPPFDGTLISSPTLVFADTIFSFAAGFNSFTYDGQVLVPFGAGDDTVTQGSISVNGDGIINDGRYPFILAAVDLAGNRTDDFGLRPFITGALVVDVSPPEIDNVGLSLNPFSPNNDGVNDITSIFFDIRGIDEVIPIGTARFCSNDADDALEAGFIELAPEFVTTDSLTPAVGDSFCMSLSNLFRGTDLVPVEEIDIDTLSNVELGRSIAPLPLLAVKLGNFSGEITFQVEGLLITPTDTVTQISSPLTFRPTDPIGTIFQTGERFSKVNSVIGVKGAEDDDFLPILLFTNAGGANVSLFDGAGNLFRQLAISPAFNGTGSYAANLGPGTQGEDFLQGETIPDDIYTFRITISDLVGFTALQSGTIVANSSPIRITGLNIFPDRFSPQNTDQQFDLTNISYTISEPGITTIKIYESTSVFDSTTVVRTLLRGFLQSAGNHTVNWDGRTDATAFPGVVTDVNGILSPNAETEYTQIITVVDRITSEADQIMNTIVIDNEPPAPPTLIQPPTPTNVSPIQITGGAELGSSIRIRVNGLIQGTATADSVSGSFNLDTVNLSEGENLIVADAFDGVLNGPEQILAGNPTADTVVVILDTKPPQVIPIDPLPGAVFMSSGIETMIVALDDGASAGANLVSGVDLLNSSFRLVSPENLPLQGNLTRIEGDTATVSGRLVQQPDTLIFVPLDTLTQEGTYTIQVSTLDLVGNVSPLNSITFSVGAATAGPTVTGTLPPDNGFVNAFFNNSLEVQATLMDNSGAGLDLNSSDLVMVNPIGEVLPGVASVIENELTLTYTLNNPLASDGSVDGTYFLRIKAADNTLTVVTDSTSFVYDTVLPDTLSVEVVTSSFVRAVLIDPRPTNSIFGTIPGRADSSGVNVVTSTMTISGPQTVLGNLRNDGISILEFIFDPAPVTPGIYTITINAFDRAGNSRTRTRTFTIGGVGTAPTLASTVPADGANLNGSFNSSLVASATLQDNSSTGINLISSSLRVLNPSGLFLQGNQTATSPGTMFFAISNPLATNGTVDGRYELVIRGEDNDPITPALVDTTSFIYDTVQPDTISVTAAVDFNNIQVVIVDVIPPGLSPSDVSGVNIVNSTMSVSENGVNVPGIVTNNGVDTLFFTFDVGPTQATQFVVVVNVQDRAGNTRQRTRSIIAGTPAAAPQLVSTIPANNSFVPPTISSVSATVLDNSGTGIDLTQTTISLKDEFGNDISGTPTGTLTSTGATLTLALTQPLASGGLEDGNFVINVTAVDNDQLSADGMDSTSFVYDSVSPDTVNVLVAADTSSVSSTVEDVVPLSGAVPSGIDIDASSITVLDPAGTAVPGTVSRTGISLLTYLFDNPLSSGGVFTIRVTIVDNAGNSQVREQSLIRGTINLLEVFPPINAGINGVPVPLARVFAVFLNVVAPGGGLDNDLSTITLTGPDTVLVAGSQAVSSDTLILNLDIPLPNEGSADGQYRIDFLATNTEGNSVADMSFFTYDNLAPDTVSITSSLTSQATTVSVLLTDGGIPPEVSGLDGIGSEVKLFDPQGMELEAASRLFTDNAQVDSTYQIDLTFPALTSNGFHRLSINALDFAGNSRLIESGFSNFVTGGPRVFAEEVPASVQATLNYFPPQPGQTVDRAVLRIFNLAGDLIYSTDVSGDLRDANKCVWQLVNDDGVGVLNGVFIYVFSVRFTDGTADTVKKTLAVIR